MTVTKTAATEDGPLTFDAEKHLYRLNGFPVPSVTQVIEPLLPYHGLPPEVREKALLRGTIVHQLTEVIDRGDWSLDWEDDAMKAGLYGYVEAWFKFLQDTDVFIEEMECRVYSVGRRFAGTLDRVIRLDGPEGVPGILDIKTGDLSPEYALQTAAYQFAWNEAWGRRRVKYEVPKRYVIQLKETGRYSLKEHTDSSDITAFLGALKVAEWRMQHGKK